MSRDIIKNEIEPLKEQAHGILQTVTVLEIADQEDFGKAVTIGNELKAATNLIKKRKEAITAPLNEALRSARDLFRPIEDDLSKTESVLKGKMLVFKEEERKALEAKQAKIEDRVDRGTIKEETAKRKIAELQSSATSKTVVSASGARATEKFITEYVIVDEKSIPREYLVPDMVKIKQAMKAGKKVAGVEARQKSIISW